MATVDELIVRIEANTAQLRREMKRGADSVRRNTNRMDRALKKSDAAFARLGAAASRFGGVLGVAALGRSVIGATIKFAKALADLSAITGATGKDLEFLKDKARDFGRATTKSAADALTAMKLIASAKPELLENAEALAAVTKETITLSEAAQIELPIAARALAIALNQFNAPAEEASRFINALAAGSKLGAAEIPGLVQAMEIAGPAFAQANIPFEDFLAIVERVAASGVPIEQFATQFRNIILKLGVGADKTNPAIVGLFEALRNLEKEGLSATESLKRFEIRGAPIVKLMLDATDSSEKLSKSITGTNIAYEQAAIQTEGLAGSTERLANAWEALNLSIGEGNGLIDQGTGLLADFGFALEDVIEKFREGEKIFPGSTLTAQINLIQDMRDALASLENIPEGVRTLLKLRAEGGFEITTPRQPIEEIPISARRDPRVVTPSNLGLDISPRFKGGPGGPLENYSARLEQVRDDTQKMLAQINQDFLRATGQDAAAIVAIFKVRKDEVEKLLREAGNISEDQIQLILGQLDTIRDANIEGLDDAAAAAKHFGDSLQSALQNAIMNGERLDKVLIRALKSAILFGVDGKGGLLGGILNTATTALSKAFTVGGSAGGGAVQPGIPRLVGERGPEIFVPNTTGVVRNNADSRRMGGQTNTIVQNNNFTVDVANAVRAEVLNAAPLIAQLAAQQVRQAGGAVRIG